MITEKVMPIALFLFFIIIGMNAFIITAAQLPDTNGNSVFTGFDTAKLSQNNSDTNHSATTSPNAGSSASIGTDTGFFLWLLDSGKPGEVGVNDFALALFGVQTYMEWFALKFPLMSAIFYGLIFFVTAIQAAVIAYAGSIIVRSVAGLVT